MTRGDAAQGQLRDDFVAFTMPRSGNGGVQNSGRRVDGACSLVTVAKGQRGRPACWAPCRPSPQCATGA